MILQNDTVRISASDNLQKVILLSNSTNEELKNIFKDEQENVALLYINEQLIGIASIENNDFSFIVPDDIKFPICSSEYSNDLISYIFLALY